MKVLIINNLNIIGGPTSVIENDIKMLRSDNITVKYVHFAQMQSGVTCDNIKIRDRKFDLYHNPFYSWYSAKKIMRIIEEYQPDIAHLHIFYGKFTPSILRVLKRKRVKIVQTVHDSRYICQKNDLFRQGNICFLCNNSRIPFGIFNNCNGSILKSFLNYVEKQILFFSSKYIDQLLFVSESQRRRHILKSKSRFLTSKVLYNTVENIDKRLIHRLNRDTVNVLILSRVVDGKGIIEVLEMFKKRRSLDNFTITLAGDGSLIPQLKVEYGDLITNGKLHLVGECKKQLKSKLLTDADVVIAPSMMFETFGLTLLEAAQYEKISLASDFGAHREVSQLTNGYVFSSLAELGVLLEHISELKPAKLDNILENNYRKNQLLKIYNEVLAR